MRPGLAIVIVGMWLCGCAGLPHSPVVPKTSAAEVEARTEAALPNGLTRSQVEAWLIAQTVTPIDTGYPDPNSGVVRRDDDGRFPGADATAVVCGILPGTGGSSLVSENFEVHFAFDANDRLLRRRVRAIYTGP